MFVSIVLSLGSVWFAEDPSVVSSRMGFNDYISNWELNEGLGDFTFDDGPYDYKGELIGAYWYHWARGYALHFDGANSYLDITDDQGPPDEIGELAEGSISAWFKIASNPPTNIIHPVFYLGGGVGGDNLSGVTIEIGHFGIAGEGLNTKLYFTVYDDSGYDPILCFDSATKLELGRWYHFVAVVGTDYNTGYLNGKEMTARFYNFGSATESKFFADVQDKRVCWLGRGFFAWIQTQQYMHGLIDDVRIFDRTLEAGEIREYYDSLAGGDATGDGVVDLQDLLYVLGVWGSCPELPKECHGDLDGDGLVNFVDVLKVLSYWN